MKVRCPNCKNLVEYKDNPFRPFCSERCQLIDLGAWASGDHAIAADHSPESEEDVPASQIQTPKPSDDDES